MMFLLQELICHFFSFFTVDGFANFLNNGLWHNTVFNNATVEETRKIVMESIRKIQQGGED